MHGCTTDNVIWQVVDSRAYGGIESHIYYLSNALIQRQGNVCVVFIQNYGLHSLEHKLRDSGIPYMKCNGIWDFVQKAKQARPSIIHSHGYKGNLVSRVIGQLCNIPTVASYHAGDCETLRLKLYTTIDRFTVFLSKPIAINEFIANTLTGKPDVIDNFVPLPSQFKSIKQIKNIGFVGRLSHEKAPDRFVALAARFPSVTFHVFGNGPMLNSLKQDATQNVKFHGHIQDMEVAWKTIDILCMPSRKEGLPIAALESMAFGVPVLAYNAGALRKLIEHTVNGWVLPAPDKARDEVGHMELTLRELHIEHVKSCGMTARETIKQHYSQNALIHDFINIYNDLNAKKEAEAKGEIYAAP